jgi:hypothetical protein
VQFVLVALGLEYVAGQVVVEMKRMNFLVVVILILLVPFSDVIIQI